MRLNTYLYSQLSFSFFPIFLALFFISSVVFLVKIASLTSIITVSFYELFKFFSYSIPQIIFYTLPGSFFISLAISLSKLSSEYELAVITSFGLDPIKIIKIFLPLTFMVSLVLLIVSLGLIPKAKYLTKEFIDFKKKEANFNIKESEFGQKFGGWLVYISSKDDKTYKDIKLFKTDKNQEHFILAKEAVLDNKEGILSFKLLDGKVFVIDDKEVNDISYETMYINDAIAGENQETFLTSFDFWLKNLKEKRNLDDFAFYTLASFLPLLSMFFLVTFGYFNPRYEKNRTAIFSIVVVVLYYILVSYAIDKISLHSLYLIPIFWLSFSYLFYSKTIKKIY